MQLDRVLASLLYAHQARYASFARLLDVQQHASRVLHPMAAHLVLQQKRECKHREVASHFRVVDKTQDPIWQMSVP